MIDLKQLQKDIYKNKLNKGFNVTDINKEFCLTYGEMAEAYEAWRKKTNRRRRGNCRCSNIFAWIIRDFKCRFRNRNFKKSK